MSIPTQYGEKTSYNQYERDTVKYKPTQVASEFTLLAAASNKRKLGEEKKVGFLGEQSIASATMDQIPDDPTN